MRRAIARGRMVPQSLSTDPRMGRLTLKAAMLFPLMWINCDDQGRLSGDPDEIKYTTCPNIDHIGKADIPELLKELEEQGFLKTYATSKLKAIQMLDWWEEQHLQWAYPSRYSPAPGWQDKLRYHPTPKEIITVNWPAAKPPRPRETPSPDSESLPGKLPGKGGKVESCVEKTKSPQDPHPSPEIKKETKTKKEKEEGKGRLPSALGSNSPSPSTSPTQIEILRTLFDCYPRAFGKDPDSRISAQLRDFSVELAAGGATLKQVEDAFKEACLQNKHSIPYVRAILLNWMGVKPVEKRARSP